MKLRNLLFGTMIACAFVACSNDDDPTPTPEAKGEASLVVSVKNGVSGITKAGTETQTGNEKNIKSLKIVLYNAETKVFLAESSTIAPDDKDDQITNNEIKFTGLNLAGTSVQILAVANVDASFANTTSDNIGVLVTDATGFTEDNLPMSSGLTDAVTLAEGDNYYGYSSVPEGSTSLSSTPLPLIRNVARVDLTGLSIDMSAATKEKYVSGTAKFEITSAFILNGRTKTKVADAGSWWNQTNVVWGNIAATYDNAATDYISGFNNSFENFTGNQIGAYSKDITDNSEKTYTIGSSSALTVNLQNNPIQFYVFENPQTKAARLFKGDESDPILSGKFATELVIKGKFSLSDAKKAGSNNIYVAEKADAYWPLVIAVDGTVSPETYMNAIHRNVVYQVSATLAGKGYKDPTTPNPDPVEMFVKTTVVDWATANQSVTIE